MPPPHVLEQTTQLDTAHAIGQGCVLQASVKGGQAAPPYCDGTVTERFCVPPPQVVEHAVQLDTAHAIGQACVLQACVKGGQAAPPCCG